MSLITGESVARTLRRIPKTRKQPRRKRVVIRATTEDMSTLEALAQSRGQSASSILSDMWADLCESIRTGRDPTGKPINWDSPLEHLPPRVKDVLAQTEHILATKKRIR